MLSVEKLRAVLAGTILMYYVLIILNINNTLVMLVHSAHTLYNLSRKTENFHEAPLPLSQNVVKDEYKEMHSYVWRSVVA